MCVRVCVRVCRCAGLRCACVFVGVHRRLAQKYVEGMAAAAAAAYTKQQYDDEGFFAPWCRVEYDGKIHQTCQPSTAGRYWPWVKAAATIASDQAATEAKQLAESAAAAKLQDTIAMERKLALDDDSCEENFAKLRQSAQEVYMLLLKGEAQQLRITATKAIADAEEALVMRSGRDAVAKDEAATDTPWVLLDSAQPGIADAKSTWQSQLPAGCATNPRILVADLTETDWTQGESVTCYQHLGETGVMLLLCSNASFANECAVLSKIFPQQTQTRCLSVACLGRARAADGAR